MLGTCIENVRKNVPLVHNITNYVTVNDAANILLACGGCPILSDEPEDVEDITTICGGLNINIGTLNSRTITSMPVSYTHLSGRPPAQVLTPMWSMFPPCSAPARRRASCSRRQSLCRWTA